MPAAAETVAPDVSCSELALPLPQPGEEEEGGIRGGVVVGKMGHTEGAGASIGGVGGVGIVGRSPEASTGPPNCDKGRVSSVKNIESNKEGKKSKWS